MSRVGKIPIKLPEGIIIDINESFIYIKGPKGELFREIHPLIEVRQNEGAIYIYPRKSSKQSQALWGLTRSLINNMVIGVSLGFTKVMEIIGVGYKAEVIDSTLKIILGFSHPVLFSLPKGIFCSVERNTLLIFNGIDKELLSQTCANIRAYKVPEPYKGKGIRYIGEVIFRKVGKTGVK